MDENNYEYIKRIEKILKNKNITTKKMLEDLGYAHGIISNWKKGSEPSAFKLIKIAEYLNIDVNYIIYGEEYEKNNIIQKWNKLDNDEKKIIEQQIDTIIAIKERKQGKLSS